MKYLFTCLKWRNLWTVQITEQFCQNCKIVERMFVESPVPNRYTRIVVSLRVDRVISEKLMNPDGE